MRFSVTLTTVAVMLLYAIPGYLLIRKKLVSTSAISAFAVLLLYVCQPFQAIYAFQKLDFSWTLIRDMLLFLVILLILMGGTLGATYWLLRNKQSDARYRVCTVGVCLGNCTFMGIPLVEALLPDYPEATVFATVCFLAMSILSWTVVSAIITRDKKYMRLSKIFLNPASISIVIALALYVTGVHLPGQLSDMVTLLSKMCTPLCMFILGMRLAVVKLKPIFADGLQYACICVKLILFPLLALLVGKLLPVSAQFAQSLYILCAVPVANVVLSFAEILGEGQETAANIVLLSTLASLVTMPVMLLLI